MRPVPIYVEHNAFAVWLRHLQHRGVVELARFPYDPASHPKRNLSRLALPSGARYSETHLAWKDTVELKWSDFRSSDQFKDIIAIVGAATV